MQDSLINQLRDLTPYDILGANTDQIEFDQQWASLETSLAEKVSSACSRLQLVGALQYKVDFVDFWERAQLQALQVYLLCTCFDVLAGQVEHIPFNLWVNNNINNVEHLISALPVDSSSNDAEQFAAMTTALYEVWMDAHGVARNFRQLITSMPEILRAELIGSYAIVRAGQPTSEWLELSQDIQLRRVINYLFARRNKFTHKAEIAPTIAPASGVYGWVWYGAFRIDDKDFDLYLTNANEDRGEVSILRVVLVGLLRHFVGYKVAIDFVESHWEIENWKRLFRQVYSELTRNERITFLYLRDEAPDLSDRPKSALWRFRVSAARKLEKSPAIDLSWFGIDDAGFRSNLSIYLQAVTNLNKHIAECELLARQQVTVRRRKNAYGRIRKQIQRIELQSVVIQVAMALDSMLNTAPQVKR